MHNASERNITNERSPGFSLAYMYKKYAQSVIDSPLFYIKRKVHRAFPSHTQAAQNGRMPAPPRCISYAVFAAFRLNILPIIRTAQIKR